MAQDFEDETIVRLREIQAKQDEQSEVLADHTRRFDRLENLLGQLVPGEPQSCLAFDMRDAPIDDLKVAERMVQCLRECGRAFDDALIDTETMMSEADWNLLRRAVGTAMGGEMFDLWRVIVRKHPQFQAAAYGG